MALTDENSGTGMVMPVAPMSGGFGGGMPYPVPMYNMGGGQSGGNGWGDSSGWWIVLLIIVIAALGGNWGGNNGGNGGGMFGGGAPIVINDGGNGGNAIQRGFDQAATMTGLNGLQSGISALSTQLCSCCCDMQGTVNNGFSNVQQSLCSGFAGVNATVNGAQNALAQQLYTNQISDLERSFAAQTANTAGMTSLQSQLAQCCCDNRLATEQVRYTIATENCADRYEAAQNTRDIIDSQTRSTQTILDKLCQLELDNYKREADNLRSELTSARFAASQTAQTAAIRAGQVEEVDALYNRLSSCPVPSMPVYGMQPIFTCNNNNNGCGCGCNGNF